MLPRPDATANSPAMIHADLETTACCFARTLHPLAGAASLRLLPACRAITHSRACMRRSGQRNILLCVCGLTPQVVTETVYAIAKSRPADLPSEIHVVSTAEGAKRVELSPLREQLADFPEVHWSAVPFSLVVPRNAEKQTDLDVTALERAMAPFFGAAARPAPA